jgi:hypothetical protein
MMFTLEIAGRAIAITDADEAQARELFDSQDFKDDLQELESDGRPLWDGAALLKVRPASEDEIDAFDEAMDEEDDEDDTLDDEDDEEGVNVLFLVPVDAEDDDSEKVN